MTFFKQFTDLIKMNRLTVDNIEQFFLPSYEHRNSVWSASYYGFIADFDEFALIKFFVVIDFLKGDYVRRCFL